MVAPKLSTRPTWKHAGIIVPLLALVLLTVWLVSPVGDFPLNDDWIYGKEVQHLLDHHSFKPHPFASAMTVAQTVWGALFAGVLGFSFTALRVSTLVLAFVAAWATAQAGRTIGLSRAVALLCGLLLLTNPLFLNLSYTFMTDVPFIAISTLSAVFFLMALRDARARDVFWASLLSALAFFVRQFGLLTAVAFVVTVALFWRGCPGLRTRRSVSALVAPWLVAGVVFVILHRAGFGENAGKHVFSGGALWDKCVGALNHTAVALTYLGLFLVPIAAGRVYCIVKRHTPWSRGHMVATMVSAAVIGMSIRGSRVFHKLPDLGNLLRDFGVGPLTFRHTWPARPDWGLVSPSIGVWWYALTSLAVVSASLLIADLVFRVALPVFRQWRSKTTPSSTGLAQQGFLLIWSVLLIVVLYNPLLPVVFDRYFVPALVPLSLLFAWGLKRCHEENHHPQTSLRVAPMWGVVLVLLIMTYVFGLVSLQDYMALNRARWEALSWLRNDQGISARDIDGGYEFNGMYTSDIFMEENQVNDFLVTGDLGWWTLSDTYAVTPWPRDNYETLKRVPYYSWLGMKERTLLVLHRTAPDTW